MTGIVTVSMIPLIIAGSDIRETPPSTRISAGIRSKALFERTEKVSIETLELLFQIE